jgi:hypothetical protein
MNQIGWHCVHIPIFPSCQNRRARRIEEIPVRHEAPVRDQNQSIWQSAKYDNVHDKTTARNKPRSKKPTSKIRDLIARYSGYDLVGWVQCLLQYTWYQIEARIPKYIDWASQSPATLSFGVIEYKLPSHCKVVMIGDWGTHMTDNVALLRQALTRFAPEAIVHLGDVYYSGTRHECEQNVLQIMDDVIAELKIKRPPFFTLPGNHDYYSGGYGFYDMIGRINATLPGCEQKTSYFCLRTEDDRWQLLGMDTGYNDRDPIKKKSPALLPNEIAWHKDKLDNFQGTTILLSHHQLFSAKEILSTGARPWLNEALHEVFQPYYDRVAAWFWGHEHNLVLFKDNMLFPGDTKALRKGRLVGCSAYEDTLADYPYAITEACKAAAFADDMPMLKPSRYKSELQTFYDHAFAVLEISPEQITVSYYEYPSWDQDFHIEHEPAIGDALRTEVLPLIQRV